MKIIQNGFFRKNTFRVGVRTDPMDWKANRTFEDFKWLHSCLKNRFPANYIPELPEIEASELSANHDKYLLSTYINHIVSCPDLVYSPELSAFLKLNEKDFPKARGVSSVDARLPHLLTLRRLRIFLISIKISLLSYWRLRKASSKWT